VAAPPSSHLSKRHLSRAAGDKPEIVEGGRPLPASGVPIYEIIAASPDANFTTIVSAPNHR
jgi:hypothetical protein